jgi:NAD(P)-dependent dehydrogenase (short-subunit alcohol dehydrogenase family)
MISTAKTIFITGVSSGLGRALATEALAAGYRVVGTVRSAAAAAEFERLQAPDHPAQPSKACILSDGSPLPQADMWSSPP